MDHDAMASLERAEHFARHVCEVMEAVATLLDAPDPRILDLTRAPEMFSECPHCTIEGLLYLAVVTFDSAKWDGARLRRQIPVMVAQVLSGQVG